jgi:hypothetical protein
MNNSAAILRALIIYAICVPLALVVGYMAVLAANSPSFSNFGMIGGLALLLCAPILLRWHHPLLILSWNLPLTMFFLPGKPSVWLPMLVLSLGISVLHRAMNRNARFIPAPQITWPLLCLTLVVLVTAKLTGGIGLHMLGDPVMGGKKYVMLLAGIVSFFALTARRVQPQQAGLFIAMFFLGGCVSVLGDLISFIPRSLYFLFLLIPADAYAYTGSISTMRFAGVSVASSAAFSYMLARYGINGIFMTGRPRRMMVFILFFALSFLGGFRSTVLISVLVFLIQFYLEGMHRTKLLPIFVFIGLLTAIICLPMANRLPLPVQRVLTLLPVNIDATVRWDAQSSLGWRLELWKALLPQVPSHLLLGKGYAITQMDAQLMGRDSPFQSNDDPSQQGLAISGDYHSGPLSVILPFGIWGAITVLWFLGAGIWALRRNRLYGDPALKTVNTFLFAAFVTKTLSFMIIFGGFSGDIQGFIGFLGLSICLNGGICRPNRQPAAAPVETPERNPLRPRLLPAFQR